MKAVLQNFKTGVLEVAEVPPPAAQAGGILVRNAASLVSAGTEKAVIELAKMNPLMKARARPDLVRKVLNKAGQDGLLETARIVRNLVNTPLPLGYSCAGIIEAVGAGIADLHPGMRVACAGLNHANHAEVVYIPRHLVTPIPESVTFSDAAFVTVGAVALHGVRQASPTLGESVVVFGLGLVGQLTVQICAAAGCRVFGIDIDPRKVALAKECGAEDGAVYEKNVATAVRVFSRGGADSVLITASTKSSEPAQLAPQLLRDRGRVVVVGDVGLEIRRREYYEKEIDLRLSRSYGPGRYDPAYEEQGHDYPIGYVRWTENRNMEAFIDLVARGRVQIEPLVSHRFPIEQAEKAYALLTGESKEPYIGILLSYDQTKLQSRTVSVTPQAPKADSAGKATRFGVIGAGQFAQGVLLPRLKSIPGVVFDSVVTGQGLTALSVARKYGAKACTSNYREVLASPDVDAVLIATPHHQHANMTAEALRAGKHVFVEKPLAIDEAGLAAVIDAHSAAPGCQIMVGFNRRFSPLAATLVDRMRGEPLVMTYRVNAGQIPATHWTQDPTSGGGRVVGEVCHFIDFMQYIAGCPPTEVIAAAAGNTQLPTDPDNILVQLRFADGSIGSIAYVSTGDASYPKERIEVFGGGRVGVIDNWRALEIRENGRKSGKHMLLSSAKGHAEELAAFVQSIRTGTPAIAFDSLVAATRSTFAIQLALRTGYPCPVNAEPPERT
jgi:predicted dehydrogenase/threonine dehydrogenase-like Zn-dependent dehydrogenase